MLSLAARGHDLLNYMFAGSLKLLRFRLRRWVEARFAPDRATSLLTEHSTVAEYLKRFPKGLLSFDLRESYPSSYRLKGPSSQAVPMGLQLYNSEIGVHSTGLSPMDMGLEFTIPLDLRIGLGVTGSGGFFANPGFPESEIYRKSGGCPGDVGHFLTQASTIPLSRKVPTTPLDSRVHR